ncbi:hypothetical protein Tco_1355256 [Tanacetum coccineum]
MLNEDILNSTAYKTYYAYANGAKEPKKARKFKKPASPQLKTVLVSPKEPTKKPSKAKKDVTSTKKTSTKPKPTKKKAPIKAYRGKCLNVLLEVALSEAAQLKEVTKQSKKDFHISHASGSDEGTGAKPGVPDVPKYDSESDKESWGDNGEEDDDDEDDTEDDDDNDGNDDGDDSNGNDDDDDNDGNDDDDKEYVDEFTDKEDDADNAKEENEEELDDAEELYKDVNVNLRKEDVEMTDADQGGADQHNVSQESGFEQEQEDAHVKLTTVHDTHKTEGPMQSSSVSSDFTKKLLNFENVSPADNKISSLMDTDSSPLLGLHIARDEQRTDSEHMVRDGQAPKKHAEGRKSDALLSRGHFIGHLSHHFGLVSDGGLRGLSIVASLRPKRQHDAAAGAPGAAADAPVVDEGDQADQVPMQAPQPPPTPPATGRTRPRDWGDLRRRCSGYDRMSVVCVDL